VAASERVEQAGSEDYHEDHMGAIFKEGFSFSGYERDLLMLNLADGKFLDVSGVSGVDSISDGRGSVFADLDNDGDLDIFLTTAQGEAHYLFRNNVGQERGWLRVEVEGTTAGRDAYGAVVQVKTRAGLLTKVKSGGGGFLSHHDGRLLFGLGDDAVAEWVEIVWPGGESQRIENVPARTAVRVVQGQEGFTEVVEKRFSLVDPLPGDEAFLAGLGIRKGQALPAITLQGAGAEGSSLGALLRPGRRTLVNFWATWCVPCAEEMPELQRLYPRLERAGVDLLGVSVDLDTAANVPGYAAARGVTYPIYTTDESTLELLFPTGEATVPLTVLVEEDGTIIEILSGWSERTERELDRLAKSAGSR
jgi:thiol-disulfide isomerase/thioredoxin